MKLAILDYVLHYIYIFALTDHLNELSSASTILLMALVVIFDWLKCYFLFEILKIIMGMVLNKKIRTFRNKWRHYKMAQLGYQ